MFLEIGAAGIGLALLVFFLYLKYRIKWTKSKATLVYILMLLTSGLLVGGAVKSALDRLGNTIASKAGDAARTYFDASRALMMLIIGGLIIGELYLAIKRKRTPTWLLILAFIAPALILAGGGPLGSLLSGARNFAVGLLG